jgi:hypothetical protein
MGAGAGAFDCDGDDATERASRAVAGRARVSRGPRGEVEARADAGRRRVEATEEVERGQRFVGVPHSAGGFFLAASPAVGGRRGVSLPGSSSAVKRGVRVRGLVKTGSHIPRDDAVIPDDAPFAEATSGHASGSPVCSYLMSVRVISSFMTSAGGAGAAGIAVPAAVDSRGVNSSSDEDHSSRPCPEWAASGASESPIHAARSPCWCIDCSCAPSTSTPTRLLTAAGAPSTVCSVPETWPWLVRTATRSKSSALWQLLHGTAASDGADAGHLCSGRFGAWGSVIAGGNGPGSSATRRSHRSSSSSIPVLLPAFCVQNRMPSRTPACLPS